MKILRLTLKKKWFDMIASGEKKEEYRYLSHYLCRKLTYGFDQPKQKYGTYEPELVQSYEFIQWDFVEFINGTRKTSPRMMLKFKGIEVNTMYTIRGIGRQSQKTNRMKTILLCIVILMLLMVLKQYV